MGEGKCAVPHLDISRTFSGSAEMCHKLLTPAEKAAVHIMQTVFLVLFLKPQKASLAGGQKREQLHWPLSLSRVVLRDSGSNCLQNRPPSKQCLLGV